MKKNSFLKVLGIIFLVTVLLSWIIPAGSYATGEYVSASETASLGLFDMLRMPLLTLYYMFQPAASIMGVMLLFLAIGAFYAVLNKTGVYQEIVESLSNKVKKSNLGIILITVMFILLSSLFAIPNVLFILVPFAVAILLKAGYSKMGAFASTVGAILIGQIGNTLGYNVWGAIAYYSDLELLSEIVIKFIILIVISVLFIFFVKPTKEKENEIPLLEKGKSKKSALALKVVSIIGFIVLVLGTFNIDAVFEITVFADFHEAIMEFELFGFTIFANLLGSINQFGTWGNYEVISILVVLTFVIGWLYSIKVEEICSSMYEGAKKMLPTAVCATLTTVIFMSILSMESSGTSVNFVNTILNGIVGEGDLTILSTTFSSIVTSIFYTDYPTAVSLSSMLYASSDTIDMTMILFQFINGLVLLIAPVSLYLIAGLTFMKINYLDWIKYIWKYALMILGFIVVVGFLISIM